MKRYHIPVRKHPRTEIQWPPPGSWECWHISYRLSLDLNDEVDVSERYYADVFGVSRTAIKNLLKKEGLVIQYRGRLGVLKDENGWFFGQPKVQRKGEPQGSHTRANRAPQESQSEKLLSNKTSSLRKGSGSKRATGEPQESQSSATREPNTKSNTESIQKLKKKTKGKKEKFELVNLFREIYIAVDGARWKWSDRLFQACAAKLSKSPQVLARKQWDRFLEATRYYIGLVESGAVDPRYQIRPDYWIHKQRRKEDPKPSDTWTDERYRPPAKQCGKCAGSGKVVRVVDEKRVAVDCECGGAA